MRYCLGGLTLFLLALMSTAQKATVAIHIKLIDGRTGEPMKKQQVGLEDRRDYHEIALRTNELGVASLNISKDAVILVHNTKDYVNCADERGGLIHNDFNVSQIVTTGVVQQISQPNRCGKASGAPAKPGELVLFVRPWRPGENL